MFFFRVFSLITFLDLLAVTFFLLKRAWNINSAPHIVFAVFLVAADSMYMRYSNELKPYMSDAFFVLCVLMTAQCYYLKKISVILLSAICCVLILFSNPTLFFVAAFFIVEFVSALWKKERKRVAAIVVSGSFVLAVFLIYYVLWLKSVAVSDYMVDFCKESRFNISLSFGKVVQNIKLLVHLFRERWLFMPLALAGCAVSLYKKEKITFVVVAAFFLAFAASSIEKFPLTDRLWIFAYVLEYIYLVVAVFYIWKMQAKPARMIMKSFMVVPLILSFLINMQFLKFADVEMYRTVHKTDFGTQAELDERVTQVYRNRGR